MNSESFPAIADSRAKVLILGSMPGRVSLQAAEYYAHPRNAFWPIICGLFSNDRFECSQDSPYPERLAFLQANGMALWDVMQSCYRDGSLDSAIDEESIVPNDFASFLNSHPQLQAIYFNGAKAEQSFKRYVRHELDEIFPHIDYQRLPSTSPAHAAMSFEDKLTAWSCVAERMRLA